MTNHDEQLNTAVARHTDEQGRECEGCGWWLYPEEEDFNGLCGDCVLEAPDGFEVVYVGNGTFKLVQIGSC